MVMDRGRLCTAHTYVALDDIVFMYNVSKRPKANPRTLMQARSGKIAVGIRTNAFKLFFGTTRTNDIHKQFIRSKADLYGIIWWAVNEIFVGDFIQVTRCCFQLVSYNELCFESSAFRLAYLLVQPLECRLGLPSPLSY